MSRSGKGGHNSGHKKLPKREIICLCNNVARDTIESAIRNGADTLNKVFDETSAGVGPCGGSCRRKLGPLLDAYLATGEFPLLIKEDRTGKPDEPGKPDGSEKPDGSD